MSYIRISISIRRKVSDQNQTNGSDQKKGIKSQVTEVVLSMVDSQHVDFVSLTESTRKSRRSSVVLVSPVTRQSSLLTCRAKRSLLYIHPAIFAQTIFRPLSPK
ncbi:uncharacterized protein YALI1_E21535g [Yarrowia lipolytica]|uniref:Uncharacterized protein n=1 Tax=Yarrowia lipolytica TaxID=4952 RepID=A0A1D8NIY4_YARLL|nr:hypothetical protein YALI1_E21535g [Yarrowia lipolytica]